MLQTYGTASKTVRKAIWIPEVITAYLEHFASSGEAMTDSVSRLMGVAEGNMSIAVTRAGDTEVLLATNNGSLYFLEDLEQECAVLPLKNTFLSVYGAISYRAIN